MAIRVGSFFNENDGFYYCVTHKTTRTEKIPTKGDYYDIICPDCEWIYNKSSETGYDEEVINKYQLKSTYEDPYFEDNKKHYDR